MINDFKPGDKVKFKHWMYLKTCWDIEWNEDKYIYGELKEILPPDKDGFIFCKILSVRGLEYDPNINTLIKAEESIITEIA